ncbi:hypothetical protein C5B96_13725 [Subtercola sp. Z020]|nr:hypothetical protein C5B96_13725 [Subtercola sp. Z020]
MPSGDPVPTSDPVPTGDPVPTSGPTATPSPAPDEAAPLATTVTIGTPPVVTYGTPLVLQATVVDSKGDPAEGTVQFTVMGNTFQTPQALVDGSVELVYGSTSFGPAPGQETVDPYFLVPPGVAVGVAFTPADATRFAPSSANLDVTIERATPSVAAGWGGDVTSLPVGGFFEVKAVVATEETPGQYVLAAPTGSVDFYIGGVLAGSAPLVADTEGYSGASAIVAGTEVGPQSVQAVYSGDSNYLPARSTPAPGLVFTPAVAPTPGPTATPGPTSPSAPGPSHLAETGASAPTLAASGAGAVGVLLLGLALLGTARRRRHGAA